MSTTINRVAYKVHPKEETYFAIKIFFSVILYFLIIKGLISLGTANEKTRLVDGVFIFYGVLIILLLVLRFVVLIGYLKGNAVKISSKQFPDIYNIVVKQSATLGLDTVPDVFILQAGGFLNAFATRFVGTNYIVIYSDVIDSAYQIDFKVVEFIIGHEMGHIKRKHITKRLLLFPAIVIPFLGSAYSRACEYTCDRIGYELCPEGAKPGMILLAAGKGLSKKVNIQAYIEQIQTESGFTNWFAEKLQSHPNLTKRVNAFNQLVPAKPVIMQEPVKLKDIVPTDDHTKFMPK
ncbi:MAG TPA: M48 family metallopeptidase [Cytophaga sp.]|nr:M48 family metallopeptidase [Cytophaga sp.]